MSKSSISFYCPAAVQSSTSTSTAASPASSHFSLPVPVSVRVHARNVSPNCCFCPTAFCAMRPESANPSTPLPNLTLLSVVYMRFPTIQIAEHSLHPPLPWARPLKQTQSVDTCSYCKANNMNAPLNTREYPCTHACAASCLSLPYLLDGAYTS